MKYFRQMSVLGVVLVLIFGTRKSDADVSQLENMEKQCLEERRKIETGRLVIEVRLTKCRRQPIYERITRTYNIVFDRINQRYRIDCRWDSPGGTTMYYEILTPDKHLDSTSPESPVVINPANGRNLTDVCMPDPMNLGLVPNNFTSLSNKGYDLESILLRPDRTDISVKKDEINDAVAWRSDYTLETELPQRCTSWIVPEMGCSLVKYISTWSKAEGREYTTALDVTPHFCMSGSVWFPRKVKFRRLLNGELLKEEIVTVKSAEFNKRVPSKEFDYAALGMPDNTPVLANGRAMTTENRSLIPEGAGPRPVEAEGAGRYELLLAMSVVGMIAFIAISGVWWIQRRSR